MSRELFEYLSDMNNRQHEFVVEKSDAATLDLLNKLAASLKQNEDNFKKLECRLVEKELLYLQDMHKHIHANPYLKSKVDKDASFERYYSIYKTNHAADLDKSVFCHHTPLDDTTTLIQAIESYLHL